MKMLYPRLEELRIGKGKTQQEIADMLYCRCEVYRRYEKGEQRLPVQVLCRLAGYYGVSADYILDLTDEPRPHK